MTGGLTPPNDPFSVALGDRRGPGPATDSGINSPPPSAGVRARAMLQRLTELTADSPAGILDEQAVGQAAGDAGLGIMVLATAPVSKGGGAIVYQLHPHRRAPERWLALLVFRGAGRERGWQLYERV